MDTSKPHGTCPHCGSTFLTQAHVMTVMVEVTEWTEANGKIVARAEGLHRDCPDSIMVDPGGNEFCCEDCGHLLPEPLILDPGGLPRRPALAHDVTAAEGWDLFDVGNGVELIQRDDEIKAFASDADAIRFVRARAEAGSLAHAWAIAVHDRNCKGRDQREAPLVEAARGVLAAWDGGDLAAAVRLLAEELDTAAETAHD